MCVRVCVNVYVCVCVGGGEIPSVEQQTKSSEIHTLLKTFLKGRTEEVGGGGCGGADKGRETEEEAESTIIKQELLLSSAHTNSLRIRYNRFSCDLQHFT